MDGGLFAIKGRRFQAFLLVANNFRALALIAEPCFQNVTDARDGSKEKY